MKATNIKWDVDNKEDIKYLPTEVEIPPEIAEAASVDEDAISDYLSDLSGYCHWGFDLEQ